MLRHCLIATLAAGCLLVSALGADAARLSGEEQTAFHVRKIQTELMVAALSCKHRFYRNQYDNFVLTYQSQLVNYGGVLRRYFARRYGSGSTSRLDKYITAIANQASLRSMTLPEFCSISAELYDAVIRIKGGRLANFIPSGRFHYLNGVNGADHVPGAH